MTAELYPVVIVDDAEDVRAIVKRQLALSGRFSVVGEGATGRHAVELAAQHQPALLVLDASMPDMDGLAAMPGILAASPATRVVMFSGFDAANLREQAMSRGATDYIEKSTPIKELPERLLRALGDGQSAAEIPRDDAFDSQSEMVLAEHLERFRTVFDQAAIGMATLTLSGTVVRANEALVNLFGLGETDIVGRPLETFFEKEGQPNVSAALRDALRNAAAQEVEHRLTGAKERRWVHSTIAAVRDSEDRPLYLFAQLEDVTDRHDALENLRASEERFRLMVESVQDYAIFMLDRDGYVSTWNLGAQRLKGYAADEIIGRHFREFYPAETKARRHPEFELDAARRDGRYEEEGWRVRKDGSEFWANVVITALFDSDGQHLGFAKVTRDMTERRASESARERAATALAVSNEELQIAARQTEEFLAIIAHELQSPVAAIGGAADILVQYWDRLDAVERDETLKRIVASGQRISRLLEDLLTTSRLDAGTFTVTPERVDLAEVIDRALREIDGAATEVTVRGAEGLHAFVDPARLVQILVNLLSNAVKYGSPPYRIEARRAGATVELRVRDEGQGADAELAPRLFEKFAKTTTSSVRGTGLGLYIVRQLARKLGGDAWYEPGPAFVVALPVADA